jgi:excisionase family DNA binding protein
MRYYTTTEAASHLKLDPSRVRILCQQGRIETIKVGDVYGIAETELERFAAVDRRPGRPRKDTSAQSTAAIPFEHGVLSR